MNHFHRWYCGSGLWRRHVERELLPWVLDGVDLRGRVIEIGTGPGMTTAWLAARVEVLVAVELDPSLARRARHAVDRRVAVINADATRLPIATGCADNVVCFTMLHHVPSVELQNVLLREAARVLRPGGMLAGSDSLPTLLFRAAHFRDTMVPIDPALLTARLRDAGLFEVTIDTTQGTVRFRAQKPATPVPRAS